MQVLLLNEFDLKMPIHASKMFSGCDPLNREQSYRDPKRQLLA